MSPANGNDGRPLEALVSILSAAPGSAGSQDYPQIESVRLREAPAAAAIAELGDGLERARGEFVIYLAPGDSLLPGAVSTLAATLVAQPSLGCAYPAFQRVDEHGVEVETVIPEELDMAGMFRLQHVPVGPGAMFRRDIGLEAARLDDGLPAFAEFAFWLRVAARGGTRRLLAPLACRREGLSQPVQGGAEAARERLALFERLLSELELPAGSEALVGSAARSACVLAAMELENGTGGSSERFFAVDRFDERWSDDACGDVDAEIAQAEAHIANLEQRLARQRAVIPLLEANIAARERRLADGGEPAEAPALPRRLVRRLRGGPR